MPIPKLDLSKASLPQLVEAFFGDSTRRMPNAAMATEIERLVSSRLLECQPIIGSEITVLLADLRGFTALSEAVPPAQIISLINRYFDVASRLIVEHGGLVDKFMGDAVMALFGAPSPSEDDLQRAIRCAVAIQQAMLAFNQGHEKRGDPPLYVGIAVSTGPAMVGRFGSEWHSEYTAIGSTVNLAARIEAYSLRGQILLSEATRNAAARFIEIGSVNEVLPKGSPAPVRLHALTAITHPQRIVVPRVEPRRSPRIRVDIPLRFCRVEDKKVLGESHEGRVQDLGYHGMCADLPVQLPPFTEIAVALEPHALERHPSDLYARVLRSRPMKDRYRTSLEFTAMAGPARQIIKRFVDERMWRN